METTTRAPPSGEGSIQASPFWARVRSRTTASPMPAPVTFLPETWGGLKGRPELALE